MRSMIHAYAHILFSTVMEDRYNTGQSGHAIAARRAGRWPDMLQRWPRTTSAIDRWWPALQEPEQDSPELPSWQTIDETVDGRIDGQQEVGDGDTIHGGHVHRLTGELVGGQDDPEKERRKLADDEDADHRDEKKRDGRLALTLSVRRLPKQAYAHPPATHRPHEEDVQNKYGDEGNSRPEDEIRDSFVQNKVDIIVPEVRVLDESDLFFYGSVFVGCVRESHLSFEEAGNVVEEGGNEDACDGCQTPHPRSEAAAVWPRHHRSTDGEVAVKGDDDYQPDGGSLSGWRQRPHVPLQVGEPIADFRWNPVGQFVQSFHNLDDEARKKVDIVCHCQRLEQEGERGIDGTTGAQHDDGEKVALETDDTDRGYDEDLQYETEAVVRGPLVAFALRHVQNQGAV